MAYKTDRAITCQLEFRRVNTTARIHSVSKHEEVVRQLICCYSETLLYAKYVMLYEIISR